MDELSQSGLHHNVRPKVDTTNSSSGDGGGGNAIDHGGEYAVSSSGKGGSGSGGGDGGSSVGWHGVVLSATEVADVAEERAAECRGRVEVARRVVTAQAHGLLAALQSLEVRSGLLVLLSEQSGLTAGLPVNAGVNHGEHSHANQLWRRMPEA